MQTIKKIFLTWLVRYLKYWGVHFESDLPPEFLVTKHAQQRLHERFRCSPQKMKKVTMKAWVHGKDTFVSHKIRDRHKNKNKVVYKYFLGHLFVFCVVHRRDMDITQKQLITVYRQRFRKH